MLTLLVVLVVIGVFLLPVSLAVWLWYFHDRHIKPLREEILNIPAKINEGNGGRGVTTSTQEMQIRAAQRPIEVELRMRESRRQLFLDRAHLLSLFRLK